MKNGDSDSMQNNFQAQDDFDHCDDEVSDDTEAEAELFDHFDENFSHPLRSSCDDILEAVQAVKLNYSFPFQDSR